MKYCHSCDMYYPDTYIKKHYLTNKHLNKVFEIKHIEKHENIFVKDIESGFCDLFNKHKRKFNYYLSRPKPMLETTLIKIFDKYPRKLKVLPDNKTPYCRILKLKHGLYVNIISILQNLIMK